jgi:hypothetical protein
MYYCGALEATPKGQKTKSNTEKQAFHQETQKPMGWLSTL